MDLFFEIGIIIILATIGGVIARALKQPLIPIYILVGILVGPVLSIITNHELISNLSMIGIAFLLFIVGLEFNLKNMKYIGSISSFGGILQVGIISLISFFIAILLGYKSIESLYLGLILAFSSTLVVIKLLSDNKEMTTLHGRIITSILLIQDIIAIIALSFLANTNGGSHLAIFNVLLKAGLLLVFAYFLSTYIFPKLFKFSAKSQELLFLVSLSVCFLFAILFSMIGFTTAIGAFVAGVTLGNLPYRIEILGKVKSLRDFFATLFFISLGMGFVFTELKSILLPLIIFTLIVIILKPLLIILICGFFGYTKKVSFYTAIYLAEISEFSLIMAYQAKAAGFMSQEMVSLTILIAIFSIATTSYLLKFEKKIYHALSGFLNFFENPSKKHALVHFDQEKQYDLILVGCDRIGSNVFDALEEMKRQYLIIDYNPDVIKELIQRKVNCIYGDISDPEILDRINLKSVSMVISTVPDMEDNKYLIKRIRSINHRAAVFVTASVAEDALELYKTGADYVILPHYLGGEKVSTLVHSTGTDLDKIIKNKYDHISDLKRKNIPRVNS